MGDQQPSANRGGHGQLCDSGADPGGESRRRDGADAPKRRRSPPKRLPDGIDVLVAVRAPAAIPYPGGEWIAWDMRRSDAPLWSANGQLGPVPTLHVLALAEGYRFTLMQYVYGDVPGRDLGEREGAAGSGIGPDSRIEVGDRFRFGDGDPKGTYAVAAAEDYDFDGWRDQFFTPEATKNPTHYDADRIITQELTVMPRIQGGVLSGTGLTLLERKERQAVTRLRAESGTLDGPGADFATVVVERKAAELAATIPQLPLPPGGARTG